MSKPVVESDDESVAIGMPDLVRARRLARQTIDSALTTLYALGVDDSRVVIESVGRGWEPGTIVEQSPEPGTPLTGRTRVVLKVAGASAIDSLPFAMRDEDEYEFRSDRLFALFDSPLAKLAYRVRRGGDYFVASPDDMVRTRRWIEEIFQLDAERWSEERWFAIARLLPALHRIAGRELALRVAFRLVFSLPVESVTMHAGMVKLTTGGTTALGVSNARLGVDAIAGTGLRDEASVEVRYGPIDLAMYLAHTGDSARRERDELYRLVLPMHLARSVRERWRVGDASQPARVGGASAGANEDAAVLGVNSYLGAPPQRRSA
ncbi:MAG: PASTA domain-containing protein [Gemmatimonadaceae bacterium]|nr:PASTA domain-containing protein [Gemmatimonadaceae bacterium]